MYRHTFCFDGTNLARMKGDKPQHARTQFPVEGLGNIILKPSPREDRAIVVFAANGNENGERKIRPGFYQINVSRLVNWVIEEGRCPDN